jgi:metal-responsive CopG/Arc/MetJ family transcriptional regulator
MPGTKTEPAEREKMKRRQVLLPDTLYDKCAELGSASDVSASAIIRYAVREFLWRKGALKKEGKE